MSLAILAFSCKKEEALNGDSGIRFSVGTAETRAAVNTADSLNKSGKSFTVEAYLESEGRPAGYDTDPHYIKGKAVNWSATDSGSGKWISSCNWIHNVYTNFWSRYPSTAPQPMCPGNGLADAQQKTCSFTYTMDAGSGTSYAKSHCPDILYAFSRKRTSLASLTPDLALKVRFNHVLSAICFRSELGDELDIKKISIKGIYRSGTCTLTAQPSMAGDNEGDSFTAQWSSHEQVETSGMTQEITKTELNDGEMSINGSKLFILIPQTLGSDAKVTVTFTDGTSDFEATASLGNVTWEAGMKYTYGISFVGKQFSLILFSESIEPWVLVDGGTIDTKKQTI